MQTSTNEDSSQLKVRDTILYLKVIKQVLKITQDQDLFTLSDVIDDTNLNTNQLLQHFMAVYCRLVGKNNDGPMELNQKDVNELKNEMSPLFANSVSNANKSMSNEDKEYVTKLEGKLKAYKSEYTKVKVIQKKQEKMIQKYEQVFQQIQMRKQSKDKESDIKNKIFGQFVTQMKVDYENELKSLKLQSDSVESITRSRSVSPVNYSRPQQSPIRFQTTQTDYLSHPSKSTQSDPDTLPLQLDDLKLKLDLLTKEKSQLFTEKQDLLLEKHRFQERYSELQQQFDILRESFDKKTQKYKNVKTELERIKVETQNDNEAGLERLQEEIQLLQKQKTEAEFRTRKFEAQFRQALRETEELREQLEQREDTYEVGSHSTSFMMFSGGSQMHQNELKVNELEKEKEFLQQKVQMLEKSNRELITYKKSLEETLNEISREEDPEKRMNMIDLNLIRRKSLIRLEQSEVFKENKVVSPDKSDHSYHHSNSYLGQKQSVVDQYTPGSKLTMMAAPLDMLDPQDMIDEEHKEGYINTDLNNILDQFVSIGTPQQRNQSNISILQQDLQDLDYATRQKSVGDEIMILHKENIQRQHSTGQEDVAQSLFGFQTEDRAVTLQQFQEESQDKNEEEEKEEEGGNVLQMLIKKQSQIPEPDRTKRYTIKEEDEYDDEEDSSDDNQECD